MSNPPQPERKEEMDTRLSQVWSKALIVIITILVSTIIGCGGGGGSGGSDGDGAGGGGDNQESIFPTNDDSISEIIGISTILIDDVEMEVASQEVIAVFEDTATKMDYSTFINYISQKGYQKIGQIPEMNLVQIMVNSDDIIATAIDELSDLPYIQHAFANLIAEESSPCPGPDYVFEGEEPSFSGDEWLTHIKAREAWDITTGCSNIAIGIIDKYVDPNSKAFINGKDITNLSLRHSGEDDTHGTTVAAIVVQKEKMENLMNIMVWHGTVRYLIMMCLDSKKNLINLILDRSY